MNVSAYIIKLIQTKNKKKFFNCIWGSNRSEFEVPTFLNALVLEHFIKEIQIKFALDFTSKLLHRTNCRQDLIID